MKQLLLKSLLLLSVFLFSCEKDEEPTPAPLGAYENGVFVINEGNFTEGDGSVTYYGRTNGTVEQTLFDNVNGTGLGDVAQSALIHEGFTYLVVNNSNKVEVVNSYTFEKEYTITDVQLPRYFTVADGKGYLTEWVSFTEPGRVAVIDLETGAIDDRITVGFGAEDIEWVNGKLYVSNSFEGTLSIIDINGDQSVKNLALSAGPAQMVVDRNGDLWVACKGGYDQDFNPLNDGAIHKINTETDEIEVTYELNTNFSAKVAINGQGNTICFFVNNAVFAIDTDGSSVPTEPLFIVNEATSLYGIGVDPVTGIVYVGDSKFFIEDGEVFRYGPDGAFLDSFDAGRGPNGFAFN